MKKNQNPFHGTALAALALGAAATTATPLLAAQAIERNLPPPPPAPSSEIVAPNAVPASQDTAPLGVNLAAVVVLGPKDALEAGQPRAAVDTARVPALDKGPVQRQLAAFIGKPLTRRLIAEIEAVIARSYRDSGFPFVSVSTPPQEITGGVVKFRVVEFHAGKIGVRGNKRASSEDILDDVRLKSGDPVDATALAEDLDWLNRNPFRRSEAVFSPGAAQGETNLDLRVSEARPWQVYAGYANSGSPSTDRDRIFVGATVADLPITDALVSYQLTGSPDFWYQNGQVFGEARHPTYVSHGARALLPVGARQDIEATFSAVESNQETSPFLTRQRTFDGSLGYRTALSNFSGFGGDLFGGVEAGHQTSDLYFAGVSVFGNAVDTYQLYAGWSDALRTALGPASANIALHVSPGGIGGRNSSADFAAYTAGRVTDASYAYTDFDLAQSVELPRGTSFSTSVSGQLANRPLPDSRQMGVYGVRGYSSDDGSFDMGATMRNEFRLPTFDLLSHIAPMRDAASPFAFVDAGYARDKASAAGSASATPISAGVGTDYRLGSAINATVSAAYAFRDAQLTKAGDVQVDFRVTVSY
jgi:hemolysin activation/secretion protein